MKITLRALKFGRSKEVSKFAVDVEVVGVAALATNLQAGWVEDKGVASECLPRVCHGGAGLLCSVLLLDMNASTTNYRGTKCSRRCMCGHA